MQTVLVQCLQHCLALGNRSVHELACGELDQVMVKGKTGYILLSQAGENAVLALMARESGKLGLILLDAKRAASILLKFYKFRYLSVFRNLHHCIF